MDQTGTQEHAIRQLASASFALLASLAPAPPFLAAWPKPGSLRAAPPSAIPVLRCLDDTLTLSSPATARLVATLVDAAPGLAWRQTYKSADFGPDFLDGYGWTELIGPIGPIPGDAMTCGFLLLGPGIHYPSHAHEAEELYVPLAGTALWQRGEAAPAPVPPGTPIHHPSWLPHAMWTHDEPLVALYCQRGGGLGAKPHIVGRS